MRRLATSLAWTLSIRLESPGLIVDTSTGGLGTRGKALEGLGLILGRYTYTYL